MPSNNQQSNPMTPLERLENAVEAMILASEKASGKQAKALESLEPMIEALVASYVKSAKEISTAVASIKEQVKQIPQAVTKSQETAADKQVEVTNALREETLDALERLGKSFSIKPVFNVPKPEVILDSKESVKLLKELIKAIDLKPLEVNVENDFTAIEKAIGRIEKLIKFEIPLDEGRVAVKLSDKDLDRLTESQSRAWQTIVTNAKLSNRLGQEVNPATEDTLALLLAQLQAINANTDQLEVKAETINLNTDALEAKLDTLITQTDSLEQYLDTVESKLQTIADNTDTLEAAPPSRASSNGAPITATTTGVIAAPSAGNHLRIVRIHLSNGGSTATWVAIRDGATGTQHYRTYLPQGGVLSLNLKASGPLDLSSATRLDIVLSAAGSVEYEIDYLTIAD